LLVCRPILLQSYEVTTDVTLSWINIHSTFVKWLFPSDFTFNE